ncbi:MAG TPA: hypothetical protein VLT33_33390, partial [Labilithrix sp.]|nr:hypothetical protein [Labilithrix sp.]
MSAVIRAFDAPGRSWTMPCTRRFMLRTNLASALAAGFATLALAACSSAAVSSASTTGPGDAAGGSRSDAALDAPASDASDAGASPAPTHLDGAFTARGATFRTSVTANGQGMLDIAFADVDDVCRTART